MKNLQTLSLERSTCADLVDLEQIDIGKIAKPASMQPKTSLWNLEIWNLNGIWMEFGWNLDGIWMEFGWSLDGIWMEFEDLEG